MGIGESDMVEEQNIKQEVTLNKTIIEKVKALHSNSKDLEKEYKRLLKTTKKVASIIQKKEQDNERELAAMKRLHEMNGGDARTVRNLAKQLRNEEKEESTLSKEEAIILQEMLNRLHNTYEHGKRIVEEDQAIYELIQAIYEKDLNDYQLETASIQKT